MSRKSISSVDVDGMLLIAFGQLTEHAGRADRVGAAGRARGAFDRQRDLGAGEPGVVPVGHQHGAGVAAFAGQTSRG